ncbi:hypothetical protein F7734_17755 [Scytonema sp. UIC 10036]|uniref:hypothetical protein n=1 Tax=Scytonema sp. UIC 10036 TaxID=2304196 RepID=UPI0012DA47EC|nr:hypothetical protein [Scytonema sp. UIC 10036]MUG94133.1 hypothetical protein [Scytonema sp. UIC 10036]
MLVTFLWHSLCYSDCDANHLRWKLRAIAFLSDRLQIYRIMNFCNKIQVIWISEVASTRVISRTPLNRS